MRCTTPSPAAGAPLGWGVAQTSRWGATSCSDKNGNVCGECQGRGTGCLSDLWLPSKGATCSVFRARADEKPLEDPQNCPTERPCAPAHRSPSARLLLAPSGGARGAGDGQPVADAQP